MRPYNQKVWAYEPETMDYTWVGDRLATVDVERIRGNVLAGRDDVSWGPNNRFRFPKRGGTGAIWQRLAGTLPPGQLHYGMQAIGIDVGAHRLTFANGLTSDYDLLVSTIPLDQLLSMSNLRPAIRLAGRSLMHSSTHVIGVGLRGQPGKNVASKSWLYFPEADVPFYRVTVFSNYSPNNVPDPTQYWSLMAEVAESPARPVDARSIVRAVCAGLEQTGLIGDPGAVTHTWYRRLEHGYPTPFCGRDAVVDPLLATLQESSIFSRGRFGAWKYEVANQDHCFAQGVEVIDSVLQNVPEKTLKLPQRRTSEPAYLVHDDRHADELAQCASVPGASL